MNVAFLLAQSAEREPERFAIRFGEAALRYREVEERAYRAACKLAELGVERGDRVALALPNHPKLAILFFACQKLGAVAVPLGSDLTRPELTREINAAGAVMVVASQQASRTLPPEDDMPSVESILLLDEEKALRDPVFAPELELTPEPAVMGAEDPSMILYTSGTLGAARGVVLSHGNVMSSVRAGVECARLVADDVLSCCLPLHHCFGLNFVLNAGLSAGAEVVLHARWQLDEIVAAIEQHAVTRFYGVPTMFRRMLAADVDPARLESLSYAFSAGATLDLATAEAWSARYGLPIHQGYGLTETSPAATYNHVSAWRAGSVGHPIEGVQIEVVHPSTGEPLPAGERGEVRVKGPNVMLGYHDDPEATAEVLRDGWLHTGDLGTLDADGYLFLQGRIKELLNPGGMSVSPQEVEEALLGMEGVSDAAVCGVHDADLGEAIHAYLVAEPGLTEGQVIGYARGCLAPYKVPRRVTFVPDIPRDPTTGKRLRRQLGRNEPQR